MVRRIRFKAIIAAFLLLSPFATASAQESSNTGEERIGDWFFGCPEGGNCQISQELIHTELKQRVAGITIVFNENRDPIVAISAPLGVLLPKGLGFELDGQATPAFAYQFCDASGCHIRVPLAEDALDGFKKGKALTMVTAGIDGKPLRFEFSLIGFSKAYQRLQTHE